MTKLTRTFKRKGGARRRLNFSKRRRVTRRGRKSNAFTSQSGSGGGIRFKSKRTSRKAYTRHLWNSTLFKEHYRTNRAISASFGTNTNTNDLVLALDAAYFVGSSPFWTVTGGAINPDVGVAVPSFTGDIILRGGTIGLRMANVLDTVAANTGTLQGTIFLIKTSKNFQSGVIPGTVQTGWDPSLIQDFETRVGKIKYRKNFLLRDADTAVVEYRVPLQKIDQTDQASLYNTYFWLILAGNVDSNLSKQVNYTRYWNMSFSGDAQ